MVGRDFFDKKIGRYRLSIDVGSGTGGVVHQAVDTSVEKSPSFAIKCVPISRVAHRWQQQIAEIINHKSVDRCQNVLKLYDIVEEDGFYFLVFRLRELDMSSAIWREKLYWRKDQLVKKAYIEILDGVFSIHQKGIYHRDLKPENILCSSVGTNIEIGDFGLSTNRRICPNTGCGTVPYMSPECGGVEGQFYDAIPADIWSLGIILFNMVTCCYPWEIARPSDKEYMRFFMRKDHLFQTFPVSESLNTLLCEILHPMPTMRISIPEIRETILKMDTFYKPPTPILSSHPRKEVLLESDSQQTCVASEAHAGVKRKCSVVS